jgi:hypothetical protein
VPDPRQHSSDLMIPAFTRGDLQDAPRSPPIDDLDAATPGFESAPLFRIRQPDALFQFLQ